MYISILCVAPILVDIVDFSVVRCSGNAFLWAGMISSGSLKNPCTLE